MARLINNKVYLSAQEAGAMLGVSYKTLQRWVETGTINAWVGTNGNRRRERRPVNIEVRYTPTGFRFYEQTSVEKLRDSFRA